MSEDGQRGRGRWGRWTSLRARLAVMLSIAILPLGVVAVVQTATVVSESQRLERSDLLARTLRAVNVERALLRRAYGSAEALGTSAALVGSENPLCPQIMQSFVAENDTIVFAGFTDADGFMRCSTAADVVDFNGFEDWQSFIADPRPMVAYNPEGEVTGAPVLIATVPIFDPDDVTLIGAASVSLPGQLMEADPDLDGVRLALMDRDGNVLASSLDASVFTRFGLIPSDLPITDGGYTRDVTTRDGNVELAVVVPLIADRVYVIGIWEGASGEFAIPFLGTGAPLFPLLMWAIALGVAVFAIDWLALRHLRQMRRRMATFSFDEPGDSYAVLDEAPREIAAIANTYNRMVDRIMADRTELAEALSERELLLREVHHRVKNNLQLIASMLNIQIRSVPDGESRRILRRMQDRVMGLSSIHKALYADNTLSSVRVDRLLDEVLQTSISIGLPAGSGARTEMTFDPVALDPDQAVPLTLLASELVTNSLKYVGRPAGGTPGIRVRLERSGNDLTLHVDNTLGESLQPAENIEGTGLGQQLIEAFVSQLGATLETEVSQTLHAVTVRCPNLLIAEVEDDDLTDGDADVMLRTAS